MRLTFLGHAGMFLETDGGTILCDPWFTPAYFGSWFPFPRNDRLDPRPFARPDYLYVSHLHHDHFDPRWLAAHVDRDATVLLPAFELDLLERALRDLGFHRFLHTRDGEPVRLDGGLEVTVFAMTAPADGPIGDSALVVTDRSARFLNQNDARPRDLEAIRALGPFDAHLTQFSGAIWYPMVYDLPDAERRALGARKRRDQMDRARAYLEAIGAPVAFPAAGPPCFLDDDLFALNDLGDDPANIFPTQPRFLAELAAHGHPGGVLLVPGSVADLDGGRVRVAHPDGDAHPEAIFSDVAAHLEAYRADWAGWLAAERARWPTERIDLVAELAGWWEPILEVAPLTRARIGAPVLLRCRDPGGEAAGERDVVLDLPSGRVRARRDDEAVEAFPFRFEVDRRLVTDLVRRRAEDWVNELFLSCRFRAHRDGPYNEALYTFFKCLSLERMAYCEGFYAAADRAAGEPEEPMWRCGDWLVQRRCPHLRADLARFGVLDGGVLECQVHHWRFDLATGRCLTSDDPAHRIRAERAEEVRGAR